MRFFRIIIMPTPFIISLAKKSNKSVEEVESIWHKAKQIAKEKFKDENDDYWKFVTYLTKRQCNESLSFKEFLDNKC